MTGCVLDSSLASTISMVASIVATVVFLLSSITTASPAQTVMDHPARTTRPRATTAVPEAGARKFTLNSTVSTSVPGGLRVRAQYPQEESRTPVLLHRGTWLRISPLCLVWHTN